MYANFNSWFLSSIQYQVFSHPNTVNPLQPQIFWVSGNLSVLLWMFNSIYFLSVMWVFSSVQFTPPHHFWPDMKHSQTCCLINLISEKCHQKVSSTYKIITCNKFNFHCKNIQICKPDGGGTHPAKSLTGRHKNDTTVQCRSVSDRWRSEHVKRCSAPWTEHRERKNAGYSFDPQLWLTAYTYSCFRRILF